MTTAVPRAALPLAGRFAQAATLDVSADRPAILHRRGEAATLHVAASCCAPGRPHGRTAGR